VKKTKKTSNAQRPTPNVEGSKPRFEVLALKLEQLSDLVPALNRKVKKNQSVVHIYSPRIHVGKWRYDVVVENLSFVSFRVRLPRPKKGGAK
jgi:hypothetical protein